jgi:hypothetical protein
VIIGFILLGFNLLMLAITRFGLHFILVMAGLLYCGLYVIFSGSPAVVSVQLFCSHNGDLLS